MIRIDTPNKVLRVWYVLDPVYPIYGVRSQSPLVHLVFEYLFLSRQWSNDVTAVTELFCNQCYCSSNRSTMLVQHHRQPKRWVKHQRAHACWEQQASAVTHSLASEHYGIWRALWVITRSDEGLVLRLEEALSFRCVLFEFSEFIVKRLSTNWEK